MDDPRRNPRILLERAVGAGVAPAAVAQWGRVDETPETEAVGTARLGPASTAATQRTIFDLASLTKPLVTTTLTLLVIRAGAVSLSTTVDTVLTELRGSNVGALDVVHLLSHSAGLPAWLPLYCIAEGDPEVLIKRLGEVPIEEPPGTRVVYSCIGFVILGLMLARISGTRLDAVFRREVLGETGLTGELGFLPDRDARSLSGGAAKAVVETRLVRELGLDPRWIPPPEPGLPDDGNARFLGGVAGNAGLFGTAAGVRALAAEYLDGGGTLLRPEERELATMQQTPKLEQTRGLGWQLAESPGSSAGPALAPQAFGHTGFTGVSVWCDPVARSVFVLLTNRNHPGHRENDLHPLRRRFHALAMASNRR